MGEKFISVEDAAKWSGLHPNTLRRLLREGVLRGHKLGWRWRISLASLREYTDPLQGFLLDRPGPKLYLRRREDPGDSSE